MVGLQHSLIQFALFSVLQHEVDGELIFEVVIEFDYVGVVEAVHNLYFVAHVCHHLLAADRLLLYLLDGVDGTCLFVLGLPNDAVRALAEHADILKIGTIGLVFPSCLYGGGQEHDPVGEFSYLH